MAFTRGLKYPLQTVNGNLALANDMELIEQQIISVIETRPFERVMRSSYGFDPKIFDTLEPNAINARLYRAIIDEVDHVDALQIDGKISASNEGHYEITVKYSVDGIPQPSLNMTLNM